jgi:hypothetical protein
MDVFILLSGWRILEPSRVFIIISLSFQFLLYSYVDSSNSHLRPLNSGQALGAPRVPVRLEKDA